ncbi:hypothetical protein E0Z10_g7466 [Xylaria hypoxylon]|uniref:Uncharacterized protein n=1 Tax=Xylaria hypoxylon TaxID=37992 RepID=A0A4Z0YS32_9PEZI|nr:hypothetical protein E0Z10_g7466 [Xylaria hypoxylon]
MQFTTHPRAEGVNATIPELYYKPQKEKGRILSRRKLWIAVTSGVLILVIAAMAAILGSLQSNRSSADGRNATASNTSIESSGIFILSSITTLETSVVVLHVFDSFSYVQHIFSANSIFKHYLPDIHP